MRILFALLAAVFAVERDTEGEFVWKGQYFGRYWFERKRAVLNKQTCTADVCYDARQLLISSLLPDLCRYRRSPRALHMIVYLDSYPRVRAAAHERYHGTDKY